MHADIVRIPLYGENEGIGVWPWAISTIMVSPTARPKPVITAAKRPGLAAGIATLRAACQRVAPSASEAEIRDGGTLEKASSARVKMSGVTANPRANPTTTALRWS